QHRHYGRSAFRTKATPDGRTALALVVIFGKLACNHDLIARHYDIHRKRRTAGPLAMSAMTNRGCKGHRIRLEAHRAAQASTLHVLPPCFRFLAAPRAPII